MAIALGPHGMSGITDSTPNGSATINAPANGSSASLNSRIADGSAKIDADTKVPAGFPSVGPPPTLPGLSSFPGTRTGTTPGHHLTYGMPSSVPEALAHDDVELRAAGFSLPSARPMAPLCRCGTVPPGPCPTPLSSWTMHGQRTRRRPHLA